ncbi:MAG TPA: VOC family protein [Sphingobacteriaceae bacterium]
MAQVNSYLYFNGDCEAAFNFYKSVFGGDFQYVGRYSDMPPSEDKTMEIDGDKIMHIALPISKETVMMGSDVGGEWAEKNVIGNNIQLSVNADSEEEAKRIFEALSAGGTVKMPLEKTFWGALFGMFVDKFGIYWMVNYDYNAH